MQNQSEINVRAENAQKLSESFTEQITSTQNEKSILTGFANLDQILHRGLHPNLIILGGGTGSGKSSFILQIADNIAKSGQDVLLFSLEMAVSELFSKSLSRITYELDPDHALTAAEIMYDYSIWEEDPELRINFLEAKEIYFKKILPHIFIYEAFNFLMMNQIRGEIRSHIDKYGKTPVIIIDYIQMLRGSVPGSTDKQSMDEVIYGLEQLRREFKTPVIGLSSLNRESYSAKAKGANIRTDSFKESGSIEYTAEILLGFNQEKSIPAQGIRKINLEVLKGRFMPAGCCLYYDFHPAYGYFEESRTQTQINTRKKDNM